MSTYYPPYSRMRTVLEHAREQTVIMSAEQDLTSNSDQIEDVMSGRVRLTASAGSVTLFVAPCLPAGGSDGQRLTLINEDTKSLITFKSAKGGVDGSRFALGNNGSRTLYYGGTLALEWSSGLSVWSEVGFNERGNL